MQQGGDLGVFRGVLTEPVHDADRVEPVGLAAEIDRIAVGRAHEGHGEGEADHFSSPFTLYMGCGGP